MELMLRDRCISCVRWLVVGVRQQFNLTIVLVGITLLAKATKVGIDMRRGSWIAQRGDIASTA